MKFNDSKILHLKFQSRASRLEKHTSPFLFCWIHSFCFNHLNIFYSNTFHALNFNKKKLNEILEFNFKRVNSGNDDDDVWFIANWTFLDTFFHVNHSNVNKSKWEIKSDMRNKKFLLSCILRGWRMSANCFLSNVFSSFSFFLIEKEILWQIVDILRQHQQ